MWVSPNHPNPPQAATPPPETGRRIATFPRGAGVELRVTLAEYRGHEYLALRVFERDQAGQWWPCKGKGCSIRMNEAGALGDVLAELASGGRPIPDHDQPQYVRPRNPRPQPRDMTGVLPPWQSDPGDEPFDECTDDARRRT